MLGSATRRLGTALSVMLLAVACGGGGGGAPPSALVFEPSTLVLQLDPGVAQDVDVAATPNFTSSGTVYVVVVDGAGVIAPSLTLIGPSNGKYIATLTTSKTLASGRHQGSLEIHVCPVQNCSQEFAGSPVRLPYDFTVGVTPNLVPLTPLAGAGDWGMRQADAAHTGHVPATLNAAAFSTRWRWIAPEASSRLSPVVTAGDLVYFSAVGSISGPNRLIALREVDAGEAWRKEFGAVGGLNDPAVASDGSVYVATSGAAGTLWAFDATSGAQRFSTAFGSDSPEQFAPVVSGGGVYLPTYAGLRRFDAATGALSWTAADALSGLGQWAPALDATRAYVAVSGSLQAQLVGDGSTAWTTLLDNYYPIPVNMGVVPVSAGNAGVIVRNHDPGLLNTTNSISRIDSATGSKVWSVSGTFVSDPVVANNVVYVANRAPLQLEARSLATGALLWQWSAFDSAEVGFIGNLLVANNVLFLSTTARTHAIDLATHASVWQYGKPGYKAMSRNGVLYIVTSYASGILDRGLTAINLH